MSTVPTTSTSFSSTSGDISATTINTGLFSTASTSDAISYSDNNFESTESSKDTGHRYISDSILSQATDLDSTSVTSGIEITTLETLTSKSIIENTSTASDASILDTSTTWKPSNDSIEILTSTVRDKIDSSDFIISTTVAPSDVPTEASKPTSELDETSESETIFTSSTTTGEFSKPYAFSETETASPTASDLKTTPVTSISSTYGRYSTTEQRPTVPSSIKENTSTVSSSETASTTWKPSNDSTEILTSTVNDSTDNKPSTTVTPSDEPTEIVTKSASEVDETSGSQMIFTNPATTREFSKPHSFTETEKTSTAASDLETTTELSISSTYSTSEYSLTKRLTSTSAIDESSGPDSSVLDTTSTTLKPSTNNSTEIVTKTESNRIDGSDFESSTTVVPSDRPTETVSKSVSKLDETTVSHMIFTNPATSNEFSEPYSFTEIETVSQTASDLKTTPESISSTYSNLEYSTTERSTITSTMGENKTIRPDSSVLDTTSTTWKPTSKDSTEIVTSIESDITGGDDFVSSTKVVPSDIPTEIVTNIFTTPVSFETPMTLNPMCTGSKGFYPNPSNCSTFYECSKGVLLLSSCAGNNHFNPIRKICEHPCQAKCDENADCPSTEDAQSTTTENILSSTSLLNATSTESGSITITAEIQTTSTILPENLVSESTSETSTLTESNTSPSHYDSTTDSSISDSTTDGSISDSTTDGSISDSTTGGSINDSTTNSSISDSTTDSSISDSTTDSSISDSTSTDVSTKYTSYPNTEVTTGHSILTDASTVKEDSTTPTLGFSTKSDVSPPYYFSSPDSSESDATTATENTSITQVTTSHSLVLTDATTLEKNSTTSTVDLSTKSNVSPPYYFSSPDYISKSDVISTEYTPNPTTLQTRHSSVSTDSTTPEYSTTVSIIDLSTSGVPLSSVTDDYLGSTESISTESNSPVTLIDETTGPFISFSPTTEPERILTETTSTEMSKIPTTRDLSSTVEQTTSEYLVTDETASDDYDSSSYVSTSETAQESSSHSSIITTVTLTTKCENGNCFTSKVPTPSTPVPYSVCHRNDFLPRPNCNEYMDCTYKVPVRMRCPLGLHFNPTTRVCDWPHSAGCGEPQNPLLNPDQYFKCPCKSCLIPSTENCSEYYVCLGFTAYKLKCSNNLLFDPKLDTCNYAAVVECSASITTGSTESTKVSTTESTTPARRRTTPSTTSKPGRFTCPSREGLFKNPGNCGKFYQCSNWHPYEMLCAGNTHFSEVTDRCEYPCDAKCDLSLACGESYSVAPSDPRCTCRTCKLPSPDSCTKYIVCLNGRVRIQNCPWGQTFDVKRNACDWADRVKCRHSETCPELNGEFPHKEDCHKFVHCSNGIPYVKKCPSVLEFDPVRRRCEWPSGRCQHSPIPKEFDIFRPEEHKEGWRCPKKFGYFSDEDHCNRFYYCSLGTPSLKECSDGLLYNHRHQTCDWKKHVRCQSNRNQIPKKCRIYNRHATCPMDRTPQPHDQCNMYYDCTAGRACAKQCPIGLYFNRTSGMCDLPANVKCFKNAQEEYSLRELSVSCLSSDQKRMPNPVDDACYYRCRQGKVISGCCSKGHVYNQHIDKCQRKTRSFRI